MAKKCSILSDIIRYYAIHPDPNTFFLPYSFLQVVTFDEYGVSSHPNHISTYRGVQLALSALSRKNSSINSILGLKLCTTLFTRKFLGLFDIPFSMIFSEYSIVNFNLIRVLSGMRAHRSQNVWYRILFVLFSRYTYVNTFVLIN